MWLTKPSHSFQFSVCPPTHINTKMILDYVDPLPYFSSIPNSFHISMRLIWIPLPDHASQFTFYTPAHRIYIIMWGCVYTFPDMIIISSMIHPLIRLIWLTVNANLFRLFAWYNCNKTYFRSFIYIFNNGCWTIFILLNTVCNRYHWFLNKLQAMTVNSGIIM